MYLYWIHTYKIEFIQTNLCRWNHCDNCRSWWFTHPKGRGGDNASVDIFRRIRIIAQYPKRRAGRAGACFNRYLRYIKEYAGSGKLDMIYHHGYTFVFIQLNDIQRMSICIVPRIKWFVNKIHIHLYRMFCYNISYANIKIVNEKLWTIREFQVIEAIVKNFP